MGWMKRFLEGVAGEPARDLTFVPLVAHKDLEIEGVDAPIEADACYVELYLESLRIAQARRLATRFHGVVYTFVGLAREGEKRAHLAAVSKPAKLAELDEDAIGRVITVEKLMMGATAYRGGPISLELGLFSVKAGNVLTPIIDYVERVSSVAGISYVGAVKPFLPLITEGMDLIAGQRKDTALEVGVDTDATLARGCVLAIIDQPKGTILDQGLTLDKNRTLFADGKELKCGYAVFSVRVTAEKSDYGEIAELRDLYGTFQLAIKDGKMKDAQDALAAFRLAVIASPDLIEKDGDKLIAKAKGKFERAFPPGGAAALIQDAPIETLAQIGLYD